MKGLNLSLKCAVENAADLSVSEFNRKYFKPQKPVLIKGLANEQPAGEKWTIDWFKETMGDLEIAVFDNNRTKHVYQTTVNPDMKMRFGDFLDIIASDEPSSIRMFRYDLYKQNPDLKKDFNTPKYFNRGPLKNMGFMFLGGKDTDVRLHYDVDYSSVLLTQFTGRKRVVLFPPDQSKYLYQLPFNTHSLADVKEGAERWPLLAKAKGYDIIQEAGDGLFMPSGYWHYNTYLNGGISVAYRSMASTPKNLYRGASFMVGTMPFNTVMSKFGGNWWRDYKHSLCMKKAESLLTAR